MIDLLVLLVSVGLTLAAAALVASWRALRPRGDDGPEPEALPAIVVVRPIRGLDPGLPVNLRAALEQRYPGEMETIFVLDDARDPAYPLVRRAVEAHMERPARPDPATRSTSAHVVLAGPRSSGRTGKLHAMIEGLRAARADAPLVAFADSDTRPPATLLAKLAHAVTRDPEVGAAFAPAVSVAPPSTAGDVGYGLLLDGLYGPQAAITMAQEGSLPFIMGQTMVLRRRALEAAGGLRASTGQLVDDMHIGAGIARAGYRNVLVPNRLPIWSEGLSWRAFHSLALRWMIYGRTGVPMWPFNAPTIAYLGAFHLAGLAAIAALLSGAHASAAFFAAASLAVPAALGVVRRLQGAAPVPWRLAWALPLTLALAPLAFLRAQLARSVEWRGRRYRLSPDGRLQSRFDGGPTSVTSLSVPSLPPE